MWQQSLSFAFSVLACSTKTLYESNKIFLGHAWHVAWRQFEPRPSIRALSTAGSVMNIGFSINGCPHTKFQFDERQQDWQVYDIDVTNVVLLKFWRRSRDSKKREWGWGLWNTACQKTPVFWIVRTPVCGENGLVEGHTYVNHVRRSFAYFPRKQMTNCKGKRNGELGWIKCR